MTRTRKSIAATAIAAASSSAAAQSAAAAFDATPAAPAEPQDMSVPVEGIQSANYVADSFAGGWRIEGSGTTFADLEPEPAPPIPFVHRLDQAHNLPEADADLVGTQAHEHSAIEFFKSRDGRTMRVICVAGRALAAQEVK